MIIPTSFIHDLLSRVNIVDTVDRHVTLKKAGANYVACCPFHSEKTPSFTVSPTKQFYHCFGCGAHGNAITFLMEYSGYNFVEAVQQLAGQVGMPLPEIQPDTTKKARSTNTQEDTAVGTIEDLFDAMRKATEFYREQLKQSDHAIDYLKKRGLDGLTAARFAIGYAPEDWRSLARVFPDYSDKRTKNILTRAGLMIVSEGGKSYDRFRGRIMFPILNPKGQIVAFGGRSIDQGEPKYLNSPETDIFVKGREIYNLFSARKAIRDAQCVIVVEGYMDVVALSQHGIEYAVATLGTAVTDFHIQKLLRHADRVVFCFDGDNAGKKAARRALENCVSQLSDGKTIQFLFLPEGEDPDSFVHQYGKQAFEQRIAQSLNLSEFLLTVFSQELNLQNDEGRAKFLHDIKPLLQRIQAPALTLMLLKRLTQMCGMDQHELAELLELKRTSSYHRRPGTPRKQPVSPYHWLLLVLLHSHRYFTSIDQTLILDCTDNNEDLAVLKTVIEFLNAHPEIVSGTSAVPLLSYFQDSPVRAMLEKLESETLAWSDDLDIDAEFFGALKKLQDQQRKRRMTELHSKPLNLLTEEEKKELQRLSMH